MANSTSIKVLVVDDDVEFRRSMQKILQKAGYQVSTASDGQQASKMVCKIFYPLVLLDVHMPGKSGLELCKEIKQKSPASEVIFVSVNDEKEITFDVKKSGAFAFLNKPVKRNVVIDYVQQALSLHPH